MEDLALHILDIAQNSIEAGAALIEIELLEDPDADTLAVEVRDNGAGMDEETLTRAADPFFTTRTTRPVGMGLALLAQAARAAGGDLALESQPVRAAAYAPHSGITTLTARPSVTSRPRFWSYWRATPI